MEMNIPPILSCSQSESGARERCKHVAARFGKKHISPPIYHSHPPAAGPEGGEEKNMLISQLPTEIGWLAGRFPYP